MNEGDIIKFKNNVLMIYLNADKWLNPEYNNTIKSENQRVRKMIAEFKNSMIMLENNFKEKVSSYNILSDDLKEWATEFIKIIRRSVSYSEENMNSICNTHINIEKACNMLEKYLTLWISALELLKEKKECC